LEQRVPVEPLECPFDFLGNEILLQVSVNDVGPFTMILDTGTDPSVLDFVTARTLGLERASGDAASPRRPYQVQLPKLAVGPVVATRVPAAAADLSQMSERFGMRLEGVLGHSFLNGRIIQIDYRRRVLRFYSTSPTIESQEYVRLPFHYDDNVLVDGIRVNGRSVTANIDTGSDGTFKFTPQAVVGLGLQSDFEEARVVTSVGYDGVRNNREGQIHSSVALGTIIAASPVVTFFGDASAYVAKSWGINIGNGFLKDYVVTIDYPNKVIVLEKP
jgi:predicted aspartyl protease